MSYVVPATLLIFIFGLMALVFPRRRPRIEEANVSVDTSDPINVFSQDVDPAIDLHEPEMEETGSGSLQDSDEEINEESGEETDDDYIELPLDAQIDEPELELELAEDVETSGDQDHGETDFSEVYEESDDDSDEIHLDIVDDQEDEENNEELEESTEDLVKKLDVYFTHEDENDSLTQDMELDEFLKFSNGENAGEEGEWDDASRLSLTGYITKLRNFESELRQELRDVMGAKDKGKRPLVEYKLQVICERKARIEEGFAWQEHLIQSTENLLEEVYKECLLNEMPGFDKDTTLEHLYLGNYRQVETVLTDASLQLDQESELAEQVYYQCGLLAEEQLNYVSAFNDYHNAYSVDIDNEDYLLATARVARILGNEKEARPWLEKVVSRGLASKARTLVQSLAQHELACIYSDTGEKKKAGALFEKSLDIREDVFGPDHPELEPVLLDYAILQESRGMYEKAEVLYKRAIEVIENGFGDKHPRLGTSLNRLAGLYEELERGKESLPLYVRALAIKEQVLGKEHYDVGIILGNIAEKLQNLGELEKAETMYQRALKIAENELGKDHPNMAIILNNMAELYMKMGKYDESAKCQDRALSLFGHHENDDYLVEIEKDEF